MIFNSFVENSEGAVADGDGVCGIIWFFLSDALGEWILMLLFVFFEVAHIEVLLVASLYLADVLPPLLLVLQVHLNVLL